MFLMFPECFCGFISGILDKKVHFEAFGAFLGMNCEFARKAQLELTGSIAENPSQYAYGPNS